MSKFKKILDDIEKVKTDILEFDAEEQEVLDEFLGSWVEREIAEDQLMDVVESGKQLSGVVHGN